MKASIFIGFDPREAAAFAVARHSVERYRTGPIPIFGLVLSDLQVRGLYTRPTEPFINSEGRKQWIDVLSIREDYDGRLSTEHANARFLVPHLAKQGWALFMDGDILARSNIARVFEGLDNSKAIYCVQHSHEPEPGTAKMDGQVQTRYARKNWSSFCLFNCDHPSNKKLTLEIVNTLPGRDLHRFCWLEDEEIGELGPEWNYLVVKPGDETKPYVTPNVVHFTLGVPDMPGYEASEYADDWRAELTRWAKGGHYEPIIQHPCG